ncbi:MAG TPA: hypothetical protein VMS12_08785 [Thermoanaerobaculia bacterium]|nr:hypothetical protein [Thermoanaerobaculia bacterium]
MKMIPGQRRDWLAVLLLLGLATLFFADVLFLGRSLYLRDLTRYYYPTKKIVREVILSGEIPYWNRFYSAGQPMAANPEYEIFYPPQWLVLLPSYDFGYRLHIVFHVYLAIAGMYLLLRSMNLQIRTAFFGAVVFALGGVYLSLVNLLPIMFAVAWMPLIFLFTRRCLLMPNLRDFSLAALLMGLQMLVGEPTTLVQTWFLMGCYGLYRAWHNPGRLSVVARNMLLIGLLGVAGLLVGAVQMFPAIDHVGDSIRSRPFDFSLVTAWSMPYAKPLELIFPNIFGHIAKDNVVWYWASGLYKSTGSAFLYSIYPGLGTAALFLAAIAVRPRGGGLVLAIVAASTLLALGGNTPLFRLLYDLKLGTSVRYPEKFAMMGLFALLMLGCFMFERVLRRDRAVIQAAMGIALGTAIVAGAILIFSFTPWYQEAFSKLWGTRATGPAKIMADIYRIDWAVALARGLILVGLLWWAKEKGTPTRWFAAFMLFVLIDLGMIGKELTPTHGRDFFTPPPVAATFDQDRENYRIFHEADWHGSTDTARKYFSTGSSVYWVVRNGLYPMTPATWGFSMVLERDYDKTALLPTVDLVDAMWKIKQERPDDWSEIFMAMSNARYRSAFVPFEEEAKRVKGNHRISRPMEFERVEEWPRYYFAEQMVRVEDAAEFTKMLSEASWSRSVAFVHIPAFEPSEGVVKSVEETNNTARIEVESEGRSFLVMSVTPHKYWSATLDGTPVELHVTNIGYQGVVIPPGRHVVEMRYRNDVVVASGGISILATLCLIPMAIFRRSATGAAEPRAHSQGVE